jgi:hypothetical protein
MALYQLREGFVAAGLDEFEQRMVILIGPAGCHWKKYRKLWIL